MHPQILNSMRQGETFFVKVNYGNYSTKTGPMSKKEAKLRAKEQRDKFKEDATVINILKLLTSFLNSLGEVAEDSKPQLEHFIAS